MKMRFSYILLLFLLGVNAMAQRDNSWMDDYPDGVWDWAQFIQMTPAKMGPYALPVPSIYDGRVRDKAEASAGYGYYEYTLGDAPTHSSNMHFYYPVAKNRVAIELTLMPYESFKYSDAVADEFHSYGGENVSGSGSGDLYINTYVQLFQQTAKRPDVTLRYSLRTASGSNVNYARHTDSPGYSFDLSMGKDVFSKEDEALRFYGLAGFFVWQQQDESKRQNDAILYGLGTSYSHGAWKFKADLGGYHGYKKKDDSPLIARLEMDAPLSDQFKLRALYEKGFRDFPYKGYHLKLVYSFDAAW